MRTKKCPDTESPEKGAARRSEFTTPRILGNFSSNQFYSDDSEDNAARDLLQFSEFASFRKEMKRNAHLPVDWASGFELNKKETLQNI